MSKAEDFFLYGSYCIANGNYDQAIVCFGNAINLKADFPEAYYNRGIVYAQIGNVENAIADYTKTIELNPEHFKAFNNRGLLHAETMNYEIAMKDYTKAIELNPDFTVAYSNRANVYSHIGEYDKSIKDFDKAIELNPGFAKIYYNRGNTFLEYEKYDKAKRDYDKVIEMNPGIPEVYNNRGYVYAHFQKYDEAIRDYDKAIQLKPDFAESYNNRGDAYYGKNDYERAENNYERAIILNPNLSLPYWGKAKILLIREQSFLAFPYLLKYYFLEPQRMFLKNCVQFVEEFKNNELHAPLFLNRVFIEYPILCSAFSLKHFYDEVFKDSSEEMLLIKLIDVNEINVPPLNGCKIKGLLYYYYGDPIYAKKMFKQIVEKIDESDIMGQYYLVISSMQYLDDSSGQFNSALIQCKEFLEKKEKNRFQLYYAGQIYLLNNDLESALKCFSECDDFLPSKFMQVIIHNRQEDKSEQKKYIESFFESIKEEELDEFKLLLNGKIIETNLEDKKWIDSILYNAHINEISEARKFIFEWLDDEQNKIKYPQYWNRGLIFDYIPDQEKKAYKIWKATGKSSSKLKDLSESIKQKYIAKLELQIKEHFKDIFVILDSLDSDKLELLIAEMIENRKLTKGEMEKYAAMIAYFLLKDRLSIHQNIFLNTFLISKFYYDNKSNLPSTENIVEAAILGAISTPVVPLISIAIPPVVASVLFGISGTYLFKISRNFFKKIVLKNLIKKEAATDSVSFNDFKEMYIEYLSELKQSDVDLFEKWDTDGT